MILRQQSQPTGQPTALPVRQGDALQTDLAGGRGTQPGQGVEQGGLAGAVAS